MPFILLVQKECCYINIDDGFDHTRNSEHSITLPQTLSSSP